MIIKSLFFIFISIYLINSNTFEITYSIEDVTDIYNPNGFNGILAAFVDFNADKWTDILMISNDGKSVRYYEAIKDMKSFRRGHDLISNSSSTIISVVPGDYDGDDFIDLLMTTSTPPLEVKVYYGNTDRATLDAEQVYVLPVTLKVEPSIVDYNNDMVPDLLVSDSNSTRVIYAAVKKARTFRLVADTTLNHENKSMAIQHCNSFFDYDGDYVADILISNEEEIEVYLNKDGDYIYEKSFKPYNNKEIKIKGHILAVDFNRSKTIDILTPVCYDDLCAHSAICVNSDYCQDIAVKDSSGKQWTFVPSVEFPFGTSIPLTLRSGDYDMDGYDDIIVNMQSIDKDESKHYRPIILLNKPCDNCGGYHRQFLPSFDIHMTYGNSSTIIATFFDLNENGNLDILVTNKNTDGIYSTRMLRTSQDGKDAYFMKVAFGSGSCSTDCPGHKVFSVNCPGSTISYVITALSDSTKQHSIAVQIYRSNSFALQLPYTIFGLDSTPNFVDEMTVGVQSNEVLRKHTWKQIIPNSQLLVLPVPNDIPKRWTLRLSLKPRLGAETGIVLASTCVLMSVIVAVLHWKEKNADKAERRQGSHRFHFDAM